MKANLLNFRVEGSGSPVILLHGLLGSLKNLTGLARVLAENFTVCRVDLPAHGGSPALEPMTFPTMSDAVIGVADELGWRDFSVLGHSLGGKVAMQLAGDHSSRVRALLIEDISPVAYPPHHREIIDAVCSVELETLSSRTQADEHISDAVPDKLPRSFLLQNLRSENGSYRWAPDLEAIKASYPDMCKAPDSKGVYTGSTLFVAGERSNYIQESHWQDISRRFPNAKYRQISGAGHWIHAEKPDRFNALARRFFMENS